MQPLDPGAADVLSGGSDLLVHSARRVPDGAADAWLTARDGRITATGRGADRPPAAPGARVLDAGGALLVPGWTDLHRHGGGGHAHEDGPGGVLGAAAAHRVHGTTRGVVSFVSDDVDALAARLAGVADLVDEHPDLLGSHLEGPFLDPSRRGAHDPAALVDPTPAAVSHLLGAARGTLRQVTLDPGRPGAAEALAAFRAAGVVVAVGHTACDHAGAAAAFHAGARLLTHALNAMPGIDRRAPGPAVAAIDDPDVVLELVLDGEHVHLSVAALLLAAAPGRIALVSDAMAAAAAGDGRYALGRLGVVVERGRAVLEDTGSLAGSTLTLDRALRVGVAAGLPLEALVAGLTAVPARVLGLTGRAGSLEPGAVCDLVLLDEELRVRRVVTSPVRLVPRSAPRRRPRQGRETTSTSDPS